MRKHLLVATLIGLSIASVSCSRSDENTTPPADQTPPSTAAVDQQNYANPQSPLANGDTNQAAPAATDNSQSTTTDNTAGSSTDTTTTAPTDSTQPADSTDNSSTTPANQ